MLPTEPIYILVKDDGNERDFVAYEQLLGESIKPFMAEVYLVNLGIMASYVLAEHDANLTDILDSSAEALSHPELLRYARSSAVREDLDSVPIIAIRMEFVHDTLTALFDIVLGRDSVGVDILGISYRDSITAPEEGLKRFTRAVADLRRLDS